MYGMVKSGVRGRGTGKGEGEGVSIIRSPWPCQSTEAGLWVRQDDGAEALAELHDRDLLLAYQFPSKEAGPLGGGQEVHVFHKCALMSQVPVFNDLIACFCSFQILLGMVTANVYLCG